MSQASLCWLDRLEGMYEESISSNQNHDYHYFDNKKLERESGAMSGSPIRDLKHWRIKENLTKRDRECASKRLQTIGICELASDLS